MAARTRSRVRCEMGRLPLMTYDTVLWETPATRATSLLVNAGIKHLLEARRYVSLIRPQRNECPLREQDAHWSRFGNDGMRPLIVDFQGRTPPARWTTSSCSPRTCSWPLRSTEVPEGTGVPAIGPAVRRSGAAAAEPERRHGGRRGRAGSRDPGIPAQGAEVPVAPGRRDG